MPKTALPKRVSEHRFAPDASPDVWASSAQYRALIENLDAGVSLVGRDYRIQRINPALGRMLGWEPGDLVGLECFRKFSDRQFPCPECPGTRAMVTGEPAVLEREIPHADGRVRLTRVKAIPFSGLDGETDGFIEVIEDVSDRKQTERALEESEKQYRLLFSTMKEGMALQRRMPDAVLTDYILLDVNPAFEKMFGVFRSQAVGARASVVYGDAAPVLLDLFARVAASGEPGSLEVVFARDRIYRISAYAQREGGLAVILEDISARKAAEEALRRSEERFRLLYENTPLSYQSLDAEGCYLEVNQAFLAMLGYAREEVIGRWAGDYMIEESRERFRKGYPRFKQRGYVHGSEFTLVRKDGGHTLVQVDGKVGYNAHGEFLQTHCILHNITERRKIDERIEHLAYYDPLTRLPNRVLLYDRLNRILAQNDREQQQVGVFFLDLDGFKGINDSLGHVVGDRLLEAVAVRLSACVRKSDTVGRLGGDEFVVVLPGITDSTLVTPVAQKILENLALPIEIDGQEIFSSASIGIAIYPIDGTDIDTLLKNADTAMYKAKDCGRNNFQFYTADMNARALERLLLCNDLRRALDRGEFSLCYQPQFDVVAGCMTGMEALLRWHHPEQGNIPPARFIPLAEETGLIIPIGRWVLETACRQSIAWQRDGHPPVKVAINLSGRQFKQPDLAEMVADILLATGLDPLLLELEITESILMENAEATQRTLQKLKGIGVHLTVDDFGTGYSSLSYLKCFPIDRIKIDRSFVNDISAQTDDAALASAIIALARSLHIRAIAEGVESREQMDFLRSRGCREMQGFYFGHPVPRDEFARLLAGGTASGWAAANTALCGE